MEKLAEQLTDHSQIKAGSLIYYPFRISDNTPQKKALMPCLVIKRDENDQLSLARINPYSNGKNRFDETAQDFPRQLLAQSGFAPHNGRKMTPSIYFDKINTVPLGSSKISLSAPSDTRTSVDLSTAKVIHDLVKAGQALLPKANKIEAEKHTRRNDRVTLGFGAKKKAIKELEQVFGKDAAVDVQADKPLNHRAKAEALFAKPLKTARKKGKIVVTPQVDERQARRAEAIIHTNGVQNKEMAGKQVKALQALFQDADPKEPLTKHAQGLIDDLQEGPQTPEQDKQAKQGRSQRAQAR